MSDYDGLLRIAHEAVDLARDLALSSSPGEHTAKGERDYATEVDYEIERRVRDFLTTAAPGIGFLGEEDGSADNIGPTYWALDPIDGTINFANRLPLCAISLALVDDGRPRIGVIDTPFLNARYHATEHQGAYRGDTRLLVEPRSNLSEAIVTIGDYAVGEGAQAKNRARLDVTAQLAATALRVRMLGSAAIDLAWLAEGRTHASITLSNLSWDIAAGSVIAREAGATLVDHFGHPHGLDSPSTIAAHADLLPELLALSSGRG